MLRPDEYPLAVGRPIDRAVGDLAEREAQGRGRAREGLEDAALKRN
jgi:hypothetical protein